jgi:uncharacterized protein (DUF1810 family)
VTEADLIRFVDAQAQVYRQVVEELTEGHKQSHWMWFIFPMAQRYAIQDMDQARRYLADPILGDRLRHNVRLLIRHKGKSALEILGSPDELKFRSCLTLFGEAASEKSDRSLFAERFGAILQWQAGPSHAGTAAVQVIRASTQLTRRIALDPYGQFFADKFSGGVCPQPTSNTARDLKKERSLSELGSPCCCMVLIAA